MTRVIAFHIYPGIRVSRPEVWWQTREFAGISLWTRGGRTKAYHAKQTIHGRQMIEQHGQQERQHSTAYFSDCMTYRYGLVRRWDEGLPSVLYVMLNPSTADQDRNDPTIERCQRRAVQLGFGEMRIANLFAFRATDPRDLRRASDREGPENADLLRDWSGVCTMTIAGWGVHGALDGQGGRVAPLLVGDVRHLGLTKDGHPRHPLYVSYAVKPQTWKKESRYAQ